jgi:hypothetical protein
MKHFMIGISGFSGTGKDTVANRLIEKFKAIRVGLTDPAKRHMADLYGFTEAQLFGPSAKRNAGDLRYPKHPNLDLVKRSEIGDILLDDIDRGTIQTKLDKNKTYYSFYDDNSLECMPYNLSYEIVNTNRRIYYVEEGDPNFWLSPRETLQKYCELMNTMYLNTWIRKSIEIQIELAKHYPRCLYTNTKGIVWRELSYKDAVENPEYIITCSPDFRHKHEIKLLREYGADDVVPIIIRVRRPSIPKPPYQHRSELEQATIPDSEFDFVLNNDDDIQDLDSKVSKAMQRVLESGRPGSVVHL